MKIIKAELFIEKLKLKSHPEGGYFSEIYRNPLKINSGFHEGSERSFATSIYFLLKSGQVSKFHQLISDEIWYYHFGSPVSVYLIDFNGNLTIETLGPDVENNEKMQVIIKAGTIFGASVNNPDSFCLMGCMVNPGFDYRDFKLISKSELLNIIPEHSEIIELLS